MIATEFLPTLVDGLAWLEQVTGPNPPASPEARLLLLAIAGQESGWQNVAQDDGGPGRGYFQDESETCGELLDNAVSSVMAHKVCAALDIPATYSSIYSSLLANPDLQVALARLDLWCNPAPLPAYGDEDAAWQYYLDTWRPGAPDRDRWSTVYPQALAADEAAAQETGA